jgi:hypothetical protein
MGHIILSKFLSFGPIFRGSNRASHNSRFCEIDDDAVAKSRLGDAVGYCIGGGYGKLGYVGPSPVVREHEVPEGSSRSCCSRYRVEQDLMYVSASVPMPGQSTIEQGICEFLFLLK